jgi:hypothetical protein
MWDDLHHTYADRRLTPPAAHTSEHSETETIGAYWTLLAEAVDDDRIKPFVARLEDPLLFNRELRVPSLAASHPAYQASGGYWLGAVSAHACC